MSLTSPNILAQIQYALIETVDSGTTWSSGHWTALEVRNMVTRRFGQFLRDTLSVTTLETFSPIGNSPRQELPDYWICTLRLAWATVADDANTYKEVPRSDTFEAVHSDQEAEYEAASRPNSYTIGEIPAPGLQLFPPTNRVGVLEHHFVGVPSSFDPASSGFSPLPDELVTYILWGVMADMLSKVGRGQDLERALYCESRYQEGVEAAKLLLQGGL